MEIVVVLKENQSQIMTLNFISPELAPQWNFAMFLLRLQTLYGVLFIQVLHSLPPLSGTLVGVIGPKKKIIILCMYLCSSVCVDINIVRKIKCMLTVRS